MAVPSGIAAEVSYLSAAIATAQPLAQASQTTITTLVLQATQLVDDTDAALLASAGALDSGIADVMPGAIIADFQAIVASAGAQLSLSDLRGLAGRVASNLTSR